MNTVDVENEIKYLVINSTFKVIEFFGGDEYMVVKIKLKRIRGIK